MSHIDLPNESATGVGIARFALAAFVVLWIALVVWALRNDERLSMAFPQPAGSGADAGSGTDAGTSGIARTSTDVPAFDALGSLEPVLETAVILAPPSAAGPILASRSPSVADADAKPAPVDDAATLGSEADDLPGSVPGPRASDSEEVPDREGTNVVVAPVVGSEATPTDAVIATPPFESAFESRRREELDLLATLLSGVTFEPLGDTLIDEARERLERAFEILFLYSRTRVELVVESRDTTDPVENAGLDRARGRQVVDYLVSRGVERDRLVVGTGEGRDLPIGEHRVRVTVEDVER